MNPSVTPKAGKPNVVTVQYEVELSGSMLDMERSIEAASHEANSMVTGHALQYFDADGTPIIIGSTKWTSKGLVNQKYQTPYGEVHVERHLYQNQDGGSTFCPLEQDARIVLTSTPKLAKSISFKYAASSSRSVSRDFTENHGRSFSSRYIKSVADTIGSIAEAKEEAWVYDVPKLPDKVKSIGVSLDGTCLLMCDDGWREAMAGCFSLYDKNGVRMHTIYLGATPEYGKEKFKASFNRELQLLRNEFVDAHFVGVADGAPSNWTYLTPKTDRQILDFYHASEYVGKAGGILYKGKKAIDKKEAWIDDQLHRLKHKKNHVNRLLRELKERRSEIKIRSDKEIMDSVITYLQNNRMRMRYAEYLEENLPIGSGVCEAACKTLIKQRLGGSGMRWKESGAQSVITLRALQQTESRWEQFWDKIDQYGVYS